MQTIKTDRGGCPTLRLFFMLFFPTTWVLQVTDRNRSSKIAAYEGILPDLGRIPSCYLTRNKLQLQLCDAKYEIFRCLKTNDLSELRCLSRGLCISLIRWKISFNVFVISSWIISTIQIWKLRGEKLQTITSFDDVQ